MKRYKLVILAPCPGCSGRNHEFYYDMTDFYADFSHGKLLGLGILNHPVLHPHWAALLCCSLAYFLIVPVCYGRIYRCPITVSMKFRGNFHNILRRY